MRRVPNNESLTLTVPEAAALLGISTSKAYQAVRSGVIPSLQIGTRRLVGRARLEAFINGTDVPAQRELAPLAIVNSPKSRAL